MNKQFLFAACAAACVIAGPALAEPLISDGLEPTLSLDLRFGGASHQDALPLHLTALFDLRSQLPRRDPDRARSAWSGGVADLTTVPAGVPLLTVFEIGASPKGVDLAKVVGRDLLANRDQLNEAGDSASADSRTWIWWVAGAITVGSVVGLAAHNSGSGSGSGSSNPNNPPPSCVIGIASAGVCLP